MSHSDSIKFLMNIQDKNINLSSKFSYTYKKGKKIKQLYATLSSNEKCSCTHCLSNNIVKNGWKTVYIKFPKFQKSSVELALKKQRFLCKECSHTFMLETSIVKKHSFISRNLKKSILLDLQQKLSLKDIASINGVSINTVQRVMDEGYKYFKPKYDNLPEVLCFDEFKSTKDSNGAMSFILLNFKTREIVDIVEDRKLNSLEEYFSRYSYGTRKKVKHIVIDMYSPYMTLIKKHFPNAKIVIDKFHIVQLINRALNKSRITVMNKFKNIDTNLYKKLKREWKLFLIEDTKLSNQRYYCHSFKRKISSSEKVDYLLKHSKVLDNDYNIYQTLLYLIKKKKYEEIYTKIKEFKDKVSPIMKTTLKTLKKYSNYIKNTLETDYTNGCLEGVNNLIKCIKRVSFGYRNFENFRKRVLIIKQVIAISNEYI